MQKENLQRHRQQGSLRYRYENARVTTKFIQEAFGHRDTYIAEHFLDNFEKSIEKRFSALSSLFQEIKSASILLYAKLSARYQIFRFGQRVKEIGIRKVLGATVSSVAVLLSKDFLKLVFIANGIAFPVAWWATHKWLEEYAYHIDVQWWMFVVAGAAAVIIALLTVLVQAIKAAGANPVASLRSE